MLFARRGTQGWEGIGLQPGNPGSRHEPSGKGPDLSVPPQGTGLLIGNSVGPATKVGIWFLQRRMTARIRTK